MKLWLRKSDTSDNLSWDLTYSIDESFQFTSLVNSTYSIVSGIFLGEAFYRRNELTWLFFRDAI